MQKFTLILILIFSLQSAASEVWLATPNPVSREELDEIQEKYRALIKDADIVSVYEALIAHPISSSQMAVVLDLDSLARAASLNGNFKKALGHYIKLAEILKAFPNVSGLEKITLSTRISIAHMSTMLKTKNADALWREAHAWAPEAALSPEEFSPAVTLRFSKPAGSIKRQKVQIKTSYDTTVFVDGQRLKAPSPANKKEFTLFLEPGNHQVSALAPGINWTIENFNVGGKNVVIKIAPMPFVNGTCENPKMLAHELPPKVKLLAVYSENCARVNSNGGWYTIEGARLTLPEKVNQTVLSDDLKPGTPATSAVTAPNKKSFLGKLTESGWFWAGVGALVLGALVISNNQTTTVPTHSTN
jgi:hypothetical protein